ncbi:ionotropic receptor 75a-like [Rhynchophorus ferrugineus]|uniref:ionotropic receptor 75a-like n=1 Tax=Rhynchophorus ferrugineus TaxID=354439 RepID=UPI003FCE4BBE
MKHWLLYLLISPLLHPVRCHIDKNAKINIVIDIIKKKQTPSSVLENLCWGPGSTIKFHRKLAENQLKFVPYIHEKNQSLTMFNHRFTVVTESSCNFMLLMEKARLQGFLGVPTVWIVFGLPQDIQTLSHYIPVNCLLIAPMENGRNLDGSLEIVLRTPYKTHRDFVGYIENVLGRWKTNGSFFEFNDLSIHRNRSNLLGMPLRVSYVIGNKETFKHMTDYREKHIDNVTKINYILYQFFCDILNTSHRAIIRSIWGFKSRQPDDTFTKGLLGDVIYDRADISGTICFTPTYRLKHLRFLFAPVKDFSVFMVFRAPSLSYYSNIFRLPFDNLLWMSIGALMVVCGVMVAMMFSWEEREKYFLRQTAENNENSPRFLDIIMMQIAIICQMDFFYEPKSVSGKLITFMTLISSTFLYTAYSARIVLLLQSNTNSITDVRLLYNAKFDFGVEDRSYNRYYFMNPADQTDEYWRRMIYENKIRQSKGDKFLPPRDGIRLVRDTYFAFHVELNVARYLVAQLFNNEEICTLRKVKSIYNNEMPYVVAHKRSPYIKLFLLSYRKLVEVGIHHREYQKLFAKSPVCLGRGNMFISVGFKESYFPFVIYAAGVCSSLFILVLEIIAASYFKRKIGF